MHNRGQGGWVTESNPERGIPNSCSSVGGQAALWFLLWLGLDCWLFLGTRDALLYDDPHYLRNINELVP